jgi:hypothetical protein
MSRDGDAKVGQRGDLVMAEMSSCSCHMMSTMRDRILH